nr:hypothetical protein [uncultured Blautia sp.]
MLKTEETKGIFETPEAKKIGAEEINDTQITGGSYAETVVGSVASGVSGAIVTVMIPGPGIPG